MRNLPKSTEHQTTSAYGGGTTTESTGQPSDMVSEANEAVSKAKPIRSGPKVGRNDPCPCGSGKKYKACHGQLV